MWMAAPRMTCGRCHDRVPRLRGVLHAAPAAGAHRAAPAHRGVDAAAARRPAAPENRVQPVSTCSGWGWPCCCWCGCTTTGTRPPGVYLPGNWPAPFGIVLVLDRLSAMMLVLTSGVALASILFATAHWHRAGVHFHPLFQFQLMGLAGAFLTADLFQPVRVFRDHAGRFCTDFCCTARAASGSRRAALHRHQPGGIVAVSDWCVHAVRHYRHPEHGRPGAQHSTVAAADRGLLHSAAAILATAFLIKAAVWPLNFWLVPGLQRCHGTGGRPVRADDQGRCLHPVAPVDAAVWL